MLVGFLLLLSGGLIGAGFALVLRDWVQRKRLSFLRQHPVQGRTLPAEEAEITIARTSGRSNAQGVGSRAADMQASAPVAKTTVAFRDSAAFEARRVQPIAPTPALKTVQAESARTQDAQPMDLSATESSPAAARGTPVPPARSWSQLHACVLHALERAQAQLSAHGLEIAAASPPLGPGENDASSTTFAVRFAGREEGWLRFELESDNHFRAKVTTLAEQTLPSPGFDRRLAPGRQTEADIDRLIAESLAPFYARAAVEAARIHARNAAAGGSAGPGASPSSQAREPDAQEESERAWLETAPALAAALRATNGAFAQIATRLVEIGTPQWDPARDRHRQTLALIVAGEDAARVHVDRLAHEFEISMASIDTDTETGGKEIGRRRRVPTDGITVQALAELVAGCVWPTIARVRSSGAPARPHG